MRSPARTSGRYYGFSEGETLDYTYEIKDDTLTIWMGERNSPAYYEGTFSEDGNTLTGAWHYPGGGWLLDDPDRHHLRHKPSFHRDTDRS